MNESRTSFQEGVDENRELMMKQRNYIEELRMRKKELEEEVQYVKGQQSMPGMMSDKK
jgi:hypothetical protein